ncbi:MAG: thiol:disulfide interchange protein DsbA/DsbL [Lysobacterales bacterium]
MTRTLLGLLFALLLPAAAFAATPAAPVEGVDYVLIDGAQPYRPLQGKVEVVEVFAYWCPHCAQFQPMVDAWKRRLPQGVRFTYVPLATESGDPLSRAYFASEALGAVERTHAALFRAMHDDGTMPMNPSDGELQDWFVGQGLPAAKLKAAWNSPATAANLRHASAFEHAVDIEGTPTLVVNGRYRIISGDHEAMLRTADALIAMLQRQRR